MYWNVLFLKCVLILGISYVVNVKADLREVYFKLHTGKQLSNVFETHSGLSEIGCARTCQSRGVLHTCSGANYNEQTRECGLSNDITEGLTDTYAGNVAIILSQTDSNKDCYDILHNGVGNVSGIYTVTLPDLGPIQVYCDMVTDGGGWTVFQYRHNGTVDFYRTFSEYENGFGELSMEFWLGLKYIQKMTTGTTSDVHITYVDASDVTVFEKLQTFYLDTDAYFTLHVGQVVESTDGTPSSLEAGGSLLYNSGYGFSAYDAGVNTNCAVQRHSGFWFKGCTWLNPNGHYVTPGTLSSYTSGWGGVVHYSWQTLKSMKSTKLMFRRN